jgi:hypothetical protein
MWSQDEVEVEVEKEEHVLADDKAELEPRHRSDHVICVSANDVDQLSFIDYSIIFLHQVMDIQTSRAPYSLSAVGLDRNTSPSSCSTIHDQTMAELQGVNARNL